jgi:hypothetical protein
LRHAHASRLPCTTARVDLFRFRKKLTTRDGAGRILAKSLMWADKKLVQNFVRRDDMVNRARGDNEAQLDELGNDTGETGADSAGQSGDLQQLSRVVDATNESVEELTEEDQAVEAAIVDGVEDAGDHPERPAHTHVEYGRPEDGPPQQGRR